MGCSFFIAHPSCQLCKLCLGLLAQRRRVLCGFDGRHRPLPLWRGISFAVTPNINHQVRSVCRYSIIGLCEDGPRCRHGHLWRVASLHVDKEKVNVRKFCAGTASSCSSWRWWALQPSSSTAFGSLPSLTTATSPPASRWGSAEAIFIKIAALCLRRLAGRALLPCVSCLCAPATSPPWGGAPKEGRPAKIFIQRSVPVAVCVAVILLTACCPNLPSHYLFTC